MPSIGEEVVGAWLRMIAGCDFVQYNVPTRDRTGEIDVIGLDLATQTAYVCEVATHLITGLQYLVDNQPDNVGRLTRKFDNDIAYTRKYLAGFQHRFMLWSPIVKIPQTKTVKHNQLRDVILIREHVQRAHDVELELIINEIYQDRLDELHHQAARITTASEFSVFRTLQIITSVHDHVAKLQKRGVSTAKLLKNSAAKT